MKTFFFGAISPSELGHFMYLPNGRQVSQRDEITLPFKYHILDGGLLPPSLPEEQGRLHLAIINGWTVLGMWDRTADRRGQSNASFITEGVHTLEEMKVIAEANFPILWARVKGTP